MNDKQRKAMFANINKHTAGQSPMKVPVAKKPAKKDAAPRLDPTEPVPKAILDDMQIADPPLYDWEDVERVIKQNYPHATKAQANELQEEVVEYLEDELSYTISWGSYDNHMAAKQFQQDATASMDAKQVLDMALERDFGYDQDGNEEGGDFAALFELYKDRHGRYPKGSPKMDVLRSLSTYTVEGVEKIHPSGAIEFGIEPEDVEASGYLDFEPLDGVSPTNKEHADEIRHIGKTFKIAVEDLAKQAEKGNDWRDASYLPELQKRLHAKGLHTYDSDTRFEVYSDADLRGQA